MTQVPADLGDVTSRETAVGLDALDPLAGFRSGFQISDPDLCYLAGNSLGRLPLPVITAVDRFLTEEWGTQLVDGWSHWLDEAQSTGDVLGEAILGAAPGQSLVQDTTSMNFYQLCVAAVRARPGRRTVIIDSGNFPTDRYILAGIAEAMDLHLVTLDNDGTGGRGSVAVDSHLETIAPAALAEHLNEDVALVTLQVVQYRSGARQDVPGITHIVHQHGALVLWDASHAGGCVDLRLDDWDVDLAVGCTYKYGNSGPGAPAWSYVNRRLQDALRVPIQGWFANEDQFDMGPVFTPANGIRGFEVATPPLMGLRAVAASHAMIREAGMGAISQKVSLGTQLMVALFDEWLAPLGFTLGTPRAAIDRGAHITVSHPEARTMARAMRVLARTIGDYRAPDSIRLAMSPLPTSYAEVWDGMARMRDLVATGQYRDVPESSTRVT